jgi:hypothetical protein
VAAVRPAQLVDRPKTPASASLIGRITAHVVALMFVGAIVFPGIQGDGCPDPFVYHDYACTIPNELIVLTNGQSRTDIEAAVAPFGGRIVFDVEEVGVFTVRFPVSRPEELAPIEKLLVEAGFSVSYSNMMELSAHR